MSSKDFVNGSIQQSVMIDGEHLPTTCGEHYSRCNMTLVTNLATSTSVLLVPIQRGIAQIELQHVNQTFKLNQEYHVLFQDINSCQITTLLDLAEFIDRRDIINSGTPIPRIVGLCLNENGVMNVRLMSITIDFMNISRSSVSVYADHIHVRLTSLETISNFIYFSDLPDCWLEQLNSQTYYFERSKIGLFDVTGVGDAEEYISYQEGTNQEFLCLHPRQLIRVSDMVLIIYCEDGSAEINMCGFSGNSVYVKLHEANDGIPYYCSSDMNSFVTVINKTIIFNSSLSVVSRNLPLTADEDVYFGTCIQNSDNVFFVFTSTLGNTYLFNLSSQDLSEGEAILFMERGVNNASFVQHQVPQYYSKNNIIVFNNGSSTVLYNTSCQTPIATINHQHHLSLVVPDEGQHPCICHKRSSVINTTTPAINNNDKDVGLIVGLTVGIVMLGVLIVVAITFLVLKYKRNICR